MEKIFRKRIIKIFNWILLISLIFIFEFGYCNVEFTTAVLTHRQSDGFYFSLCRGIVYIAILVTIYFLNKSNVIKEVSDSFKNKSKKIALILYVIIAALVFAFYLYKFLVKQEIALIQFSMVSILLISTFLAIEYITNKYTTNIISIFLIGAVFCITVNAYHTLDEKKHFMSAYNLSYGNINYEEPVVDTQFMTELQKGTHYSIFEKFFKTKYKFQEGTLPEESTVDSIPATYNPIIYIPSALGILVGRLLQGSVADIFLLGRLFNLIAYISLLTLTIKILPYKRNLFFAMMSIPIILCFSSTYSVDGIGIGLISLFIAYCLKLHANKDNIKLKDLIILAAIYTLSLSFKSMSYAFVGILIFLLPLKDIIKKYKKQLPLIIIGFIITNLLVLSIQPKVNLTDNRYENVNSTEQIKNAIHNPLIIVEAMANHIGNTLLNMEWLKDFNPQAYLSSKAKNVFVIMFIYYFYIAFKDDSINFTAKEKIIMLITFLLTFGFTSGILYIACAPVGANYIMGYQTRYIFPIITLIMMCLSNKTLKSSNDENLIMKITTVQVIFIALGLLGAILK